jgi:hypothetical protein
MDRHYASLRPEHVRERAAALERFAQWESRHPADPSPSAAIAGVAFLYDLLPVISRARPIDVSGVAEMHRALSVLRPVRA